MKRSEFVNAYALDKIERIEEHAARVRRRFPEKTAEITADADAAIMSVRRIVTRWETSNSTIDEAMRGIANVTTGFQTI